MIVRMKTLCGCEQTISDVKPEDIEAHPFLERFLRSGHVRMAQYDTYPRAGWARVFARTQAEVQVEPGGVVEYREVER